MASFAEEPLRRREHGMSRMQWQGADLVIGTHDLQAHKRRNATCRQGQLSASLKRRIQF